MNLPQIPGYEFEVLLGEGGSGASYRCRCDGGIYRTVKVLNGMAVNPGLLSHALTTVSTLPQHANLAPIHTFNLGQAPYYYTSDYYGLEGNQQPAVLAHFAGKLRPNQSWDLIEQLSGALAFLHKYDVVHTCVRPSNIFVNYDAASDSYLLKLSDFGQGLVAGLHYYELRDSGFFSSPEQLTDGDFSHGKGKRWDVYSFGVAAFYLLTGKLPRLQDRYRSFLEANSAGSSPLHQEDPAEYFTGIQREMVYQWPRPPKNEYEGKLRSVVDRCLKVDPAERPVDLREVSREFESIRHNADLELLSKQHRAQLRGKTIKVRTLLGTTGIFLGASVLLLISAIIGFSRHMTAVAEIGKAEQRRMADLNKLQQLSDEKVDREVSLRREAQLVATEKSEAASTLVRDLKRTSAYTDRFFASLLSMENIDVPGFQDMRRSELDRSVEYFETFRNRYGGEEDFLPEVARAHQFLGQVRLAQGRLTEASADLLLARRSMDSLLSSGAVGPAFLRQTALIERDLAEIEQLRGRLQGSREALERSSKRFANLQEKQSSDETVVDMMTNRYQLATVEVADGNLERG
ncbi:MAG: protein kinase, partial [Verrucomicrobiota bacterium]